MRTAALIVACCCSFVLGRASSSIVIDIPDIVPDVVVDEKPPVPGDGKHVLVLYESDDKLSMPRDQRSIIDAVPVREWLQSNGWQAEFWDDDTVNVTAPEWFTEAHKLPRELEFWVVISNGKTGYSGPLPPTVEAFKELVGRYQ